MHWTLMLNMLSRQVGGHDGVWAWQLCIIGVRLPLQLCSWHSTDWLTRSETSTGWPCSPALRLLPAIRT